MNRLLSKKKAKDGYVNDQAFDTLHSPPLTPPQPQKPQSRWRKPKKVPVEEKPQLDLAAVLPPSDDFRTSLIMPNLSARFSMLREQDDPTSKLGKASDDSVLQPRQKSRLMEYGFGSSALGDIAEVASARSSMKPPLAASSSRQQSYGSEDGYGSDNDFSTNGGIMTRARPGEGNTLFGGRQKIYKILPSGPGSSRSLGRALYGDDVTTSAFQKHKQHETARKAATEAQSARPSEDSRAFDFDLGQHQAQAGGQEETSGHPLTDSAKDLSHSPSFSSYDKKRSTTSSTARSEARSSTAATSIASQPVSNAPAPAVHSPPPALPQLERSLIKTRRLYEQGLDQDIREQQTSALTRLNSIQRQRPNGGVRPSPPYLLHSRSAGALHERPAQPVYTSRAQSPPPSGGLIIFGSIRQPMSSASSPVASFPQSPLSPTLSDGDDTGVLSQAIEPGDRGKATALGAFNRPKQQFDEQQYVQRQQQLQRSNSQITGPKREPPTSLLQQPLGRLAPSRERSNARYAVRQRSDSREIGRQQSIPREAGRQRSDSRGEPAPRSRSRSAPGKHEPAKAFSVFQNAANQIRGTTSPEIQRPAIPDSQHTFFGAISASDSEDDDEPRGSEDHDRHQQDFLEDFPAPANTGRWMPTPLPSVSEHPALHSESSRRTLLEQEEVPELRPLRPQPSVQSLKEHPALLGAQQADDEHDSPTQGPSGEALSGLVQHLRNQSNVSTIYPNEQNIPEQLDVPEVPKAFPPQFQNNPGYPARSTYGSDSRVDSTYTNSNPWDLDEFDGPSYYYRDSTRNSTAVSPVDGARPSYPPLPHPASRTNMGPERQSAVSQSSEGTNGTTWQSELRTQHTRDTSATTQQERDAFANELAARQRAIQENLKGIVESESRGSSPAPSASGAFKAFGILRSMSSRESVDPRREPSAKALKMLGIGSSSSNGSNVAVDARTDRLNGFDSGRGRNESGSRTRPVPTVQSRGPQHNTPAGRREWEQRQQGDSETGMQQQARQQATPPASATRGPRTRSNSAVSTGRSHSRTGPYRDDLEKAMMEGTGSSAARHPGSSPMVPQQFTPRASPEQSQAQFQSAPPESAARSRSNSKSSGPPAGYYDAPALHPIQTGQNGRLASTGPSPVTLPSNLYSPSGISPRPSPIASPYAHNQTPLLAGPTSPTAATYSTAGNTNWRNASGRPSGPLLRKKTISKSTISEPVLLSSTSKIDTVDLPPGASLKNGMDDLSPPPPSHMPPPARRRKPLNLFGLSRVDSAPGNQRSYDFGRSRTPDPWMTTPSRPPPQLRPHRSFTSAAPPRPWRQRASPQNLFARSGAASPAPRPLEGAMF